MQPNPLIEQQRQEDEARRQAELFRYPFHVVCVYDDADFPVVREVRNYCNSNNLVFRARPYNIDTHTEDVVIRRLPAFHIYLKGYVQETHYYDTNPVHKIQTLVWAYQDECMANEQKAARRRERWESFLALFRRKVALDPNKNLSHKNHTH